MRMYVTLGLSNVRDMQLEAPVRDHTVSAHIYLQYTRKSSLFYTRRRLLHHGNACPFDRYDRHKYFFLVSRRLKKKFLNFTPINLKQSQINCILSLIWTI